MRRVQINGIGRSVRTKSVTIHMTALFEYTAKSYKLCLLLTTIEHDKLFERLLAVTLGIALSERRWSETSVPCSLYREALEDLECYQRSVRQLWW